MVFIDRPVTFPLHAKGCTQPHLPLSRLPETPVWATAAWAVSFCPKLEAVCHFLHLFTLSHLIGRHPPPAAAVPLEAVPQAVFSMEVNRKLFMENEKMSSSATSPHPQPVSTLLSLVLVLYSVCGRHAVISTTKAKKLYRFSHVLWANENKSAIALCGFMMHDETAWLQPPVELSGKTDTNGQAVNGNVPENIPRSQNKDCWRRVGNV